jgi:hypothetical protein
VSHVPRLGDELDLADHWVLLDQVEEGAEAVDLVELTGQGGGQVEPEPVHVHLGDPVPEAVHDELEGVGVCRVETVAGSGGVVVEPGVVRDQTVVSRVVDPLEGEDGPPVVPLGGVVVDDVEDHFQTRGVKRLHHRLELTDLIAGPPCAGVAVVGGEEPDGVVAPVVGQPPVHEEHVVDELVDG